MREDHTVHEVLVPFLVHRLGAECYIELGVAEGATLRAVWSLTQGKCRCIGVDDGDRRPLIDKSIEMYRMTTDKFFEGPAANITADVIFIDADHHHLQAAKDFRNSWKILRPEGIILMHDTEPVNMEATGSRMCGDVWRFTQILASENQEAVTLPFHPGLTIIRKREKWGPQS